LNSEAALWAELDPNALCPEKALGAVERALWAGEVLGTDPSTLDGSVNFGRTPLEMALFGAEGVEMEFELMELLMEVEGVAETLGLEGRGHLIRDVRRDAGGRGLARLLLGGLRVALIPGELRVREAEATSARLEGWLHDRRRRGACLKGGVFLSRRHATSAVLLVFRGERQVDDTSAVLLLVLPGAVSTTASAVEATTVLRLMLLLLLVLLEAVFAVETATSAVVTVASSSTTFHGLSRRELPLHILLHRAIHLCGVVRL